MKRAEALDALRGYAILTMVFSAEIPYKVLPAWMYHAQVPPPDHVFNALIPGITWVDLVFPFFLFSMGAAIPLALSRRLDKRSSFLAAAKRGILLAAFAIVIEHLRPQAPVVLLAAFALIFLAYARLPGRWALTAAGWLGLAALLAYLRYPGGGFSLYRSDIILILLANSAFFGALAWLATRESLLARLCMLGGLFALRLAPEGSWFSQLCARAPFPWLFQCRYVQYLFIVIPGTIAGDRILAWMKSTEEAPDAWPRGRRLALAAILASCIIVNLIGLKARWILATTLAAGALSAAAWRLCAAPRSAAERLMRELIVWGSYWLMLGLLFEPFEGGIKKDPPTMSYYFVASGLALFLLAAFTALGESLKRSRWGRLLIENGQNPMIAYVGMDALVRPVLALTGLEALLARLSPTPWLGVLRGGLTTWLLALIVSRFTRRGLFWRT